MVNNAIKSRFTKLKLPEIFLEELDATLARERRPYVRRRLLALRCVLSGKSVAQAAKSAKVHVGSVTRWLRLVRQTGWTALMQDDGRSGRKAREPMTPAAVERAREDIRIVLAKEPDWETRKRLVAVDQLLAGTAPEVAARDAYMTRGVVKGWLVKFERDGVLALVSKSPSRATKLHIDADSSKLRALAAVQSNWQMARRLRALANITDGMSTSECATRLRVHERTVEAWAQLFLTEGLEGLLRRTLPERRSS